MLNAVLLVLLTAAPIVGQDKPKAIDLTGKWVMTLEMEIGTASPTLELKQDGTKLTGTYAGRYGKFPLEGTLKERAIEFSVTINADGTTVAMSFKGEVAADGESMKGHASLGEAGDAAWTAKRDKT